MHPLLSEYVRGPQSLAALAAIIQAHQQQPPQAPLHDLRKRKPMVVVGTDWPKGQITP